VALSAARHSQVDKKKSGRWERPLRRKNWEDGSINHRQAPAWTASLDFAAPETATPLRNV
jgi:hypothetical protein